MPDVQPFRAVRYTGAAGPLGDLVAPPYDTVSEEERRALRARSPYNVVRLTLPESPEEAGRLYASWLADGVLARDPEEAAWLLVEEFVGPDGVARERSGLVASLAAVPYGRGGVLPHERTHPRVREERLRLLRATRVQPEPILVLHDGPLPLETPPRPPDLAVDGSRLWRLDPAALEEAPGELLIADGHHRYESAIALGAELRAQPRIMALLVSTDDPGLHVFPTHRLFRGRPDLRRCEEGEACSGVEEALERLAEEPPGRAAAVLHRPGRTALLRGREGELDVELVDRFGLQGIAYTPRVGEAVAAVERGDADAAFLLRGPRVADVFALARKGRRLPPKSTFFYPKPLSGLLFHPVEA